MKTPPTVAAIQRVLDDPDETWAPAELVRRIVEGEHPVRVWRTHRGMTARSLAGAAGIPSSYLSAIERGVKPGSVKALKSLATASRRAAGRSRVTAARRSWTASTFRLVGASTQSSRRSTVRGRMTSWYLPA